MFTADIMLRARAVLSALLKSTVEPSVRVNWMRTQDHDGWSALHYAARSGLLSRIEWSVFETSLSRIPVNLQTYVALWQWQLVYWC